LLLAIWNDRTAQQQNVLRAIAADIAGLTTSESLNRFSLTSSGSATNTAKDLVAAGLLTKSQTATGYDYDSPFFRSWIRLTTLDDVGLLPPY
jgi:hypothetical protein